MKDPRSCACDRLRGTGEFSLRKLPRPDVSYEAVCVSCETTYWLSSAEAQKALEPSMLEAGQRALAELEARTGSADVVKARQARERFSVFRPVRDALVMTARRLTRIFRGGGNS